MKRSSPWSCFSTVVAFFIARSGLPNRRALALAFSTSFLLFFYATYHQRSTADYWVDTSLMRKPLTVPYNVILSNRIALERVPAWVQHGDSRGVHGKDSPNVESVGLRLAFDATSTDVVIAILNEIRRLKGPPSHESESPSAPLYLDGLSYGEVYVSSTVQKNRQHLFLVNSQLTKSSIWLLSGNALSPETSKAMNLEHISDMDVSDSIRVKEFSAANGNSLRHGFSSESPHADAPELWSALPENTEFDVIFSSGLHSVKTVQQQLEQLVLGRKLKRDFAIVWDSVPLDDGGLSALQLLSSSVTKMLKEQDRFDETTLFANILWCSPWTTDEFGLKAVAVMSTFPLDFLFSRR